MATAKRIDPLVNTRFEIEMSQKNDKYVPFGIFSEFTGLSAEVEVLLIEEGGCNGYIHKLPVRTKFSDITLKRGIIPEDNQDALWKWLEAVINGKFQRKNVSVVLYDASGEWRRRWNFENAYPVKWEGPTLKADDRVITMETLVLAHEGMKMVSR